MSGTTIEPLVFDYLAVSGAQADLEGDWATMDRAAVSFPSAQTMIDSVPWFWLQAWA